MKIEISDRCLKSRQGKYVIYDVDWLLKNLASEVALLWDSKHRKVQKIDKNMIWREEEMNEDT